jgi:Serine dehydrogenase proteinase
MAAPSTQFWASVHQVATRLDADIYLFSGPIDHEPVTKLLDAYREASKRKNCVLILTTYGGSPDAAFLLARFIKRKYSDGQFFLFVLGRCKSAGTLVALGADEIVMSVYGEMGPLDIQLAKEDSLWDRNSGLDIFAALNVINSQAYAIFELHFSQLITETGGTITTRTAADIATNIATGLLTPITAQVDPLRLGSMQRSVAITRKYGELLKPHNPTLVERLITGYPSHGFVIDFQEAQEIFGCVRELDDDEAQLEQHLRTALLAVHQCECVRTPHNVGIVACLTPSAALQQELPLDADSSGADDPDARSNPSDGEADLNGSTASASHSSGVQPDVRDFARVSAASCSPATEIRDV